MRKAHRCVNLVRTNQFKRFADLANRWQDLFAHQANTRHRALMIDLSLIGVEHQDPGSGFFQPHLNFRNNLFRRTGDDRARFELRFQRN